MEFFKVGQLMCVGEGVLYHWHHLRQRGRCVKPQGVTCVFQVWHQRNGIRPANDTNNYGRSPSGAFPGCPCQLYFKRIMRACHISATNGEKVPEEFSCWGWDKATPDASTNNVGMKMAYE